MRRFIFIIVVLVFAFCAGLKFGMAKPVNAQVNSNAAQITCIANDLSKYLAVMVAGTKGLPNINLLSPAFNLTNPAEFGIFKAMKGGGGWETLKQLWGFAGNTYTINNVRAHDWYIRNFNWIGEAVNGASTTDHQMKMVFTEYGDFDTFGKGAGLGHTNRTQIIADMVQDFKDSATDGTVAAINYFDAMSGYRNPDPNFAGHMLSNDEIAQIVGNDPTKAGQNSGIMPVAGGALPEAVKAAGIPNGWVLEIVGGPADLAAATVFVNTAHADGYNPILRTCVGNTCGFADPQIYVNFLKSLNAQINGPVWIVAGPNEPMSEHWAAPECAPEAAPFSLVDIPCNETYASVIGNNAPDFHSLRPYPTSPCNKQKLNEVLMCGHDLVVKDTYEFTDGGPGCTTIINADGSQTHHCLFSVTGATSDVSLGLLNAFFPIMGNTEKVPNSTNATLPYSSRNTIDFKQRVNEYVSWYLNGVTFRAEEEPELANIPSKLSNIINLSGPLKKLLPFDRVITDIQRTSREKQLDNIGTARHNETVTCGTANNPNTCYSVSNNYVRISDVIQFQAQIGRTRFYTDNYNSLPYVPFSSTEDRLGDANSVLNNPAPSCSQTPLKIDSGITCVSYTPAVSTRDLYFAHIDEDNELGALLQNTFKPAGVVGAPADPNQLTQQKATPYCELLESRTNPGDKLYGELVRPGDTATKPLNGTLKYSANFVCDFSVPSATAIDKCVQSSCNGCGVTNYPTIDPATCNSIYSPPDLSNPGYGGCVARCNSTSQTCQREVYVPLSIQIGTPDIDLTWDRFVAGGMSIVKRIFPKIGPNTPIETLNDIPGTSPANYASSHIAGSVAPLQEQTLAGNPTAQRPGSTANIYFPHIGSVYDYFLKGIQKALRPKGIEELPASGTIASAMCTIAGSNFKSQALLDIIANAARWANIPVQLLISVAEKEGCGYIGSPNGLCGMDDAAVLQYSSAGASYPRNCSSGSGASGPMQIRNDVFGPWSSAVVQATGESRTPNNCNIEDSIYAAAWILSANYAQALCPKVGYNTANSPVSSSWTLTDMQRSVTKWVNGCMVTGQAICTDRAGLPGNFSSTYCQIVADNLSKIQTTCNN